MEYGTIKPIDITQEMRSAYLDYAMSVIVARALPDVRDGLKPVQRRVIYTMHELGLRPSTPYKKSARIVGDTLGRYHPHGDAAVYEAMVRMAQDFTMRYPLVDGQGNLGSVDGDAPAAMRYTEARLAPIAEEMLADIDKETVDFVDNFDGTLKEPRVLPAALPNLLLNGASGIAVGMATNIPPHNLNELCAAISLLIENPEASVEELMRVLPGPDFPTGGIILGQEGIRMAYSTGKGHFVLRARAHIEEATRGRVSIIVTELPYQVNKARLLERIAELVKQERLPDISDLRDESDRSGMRIVITLKREADPKAVLSQLFRLTPMQITFGVNLLALVDGTQPRVLPLKRLLQHYIAHRQEVILRRTRHDLEKARQRAHILEGLRIALDHLDAVIETIRRSQTADTARQNLMKRFHLTEIQAQAILELQLRRLAALERKKIEEEYAEVRRRIGELEDVLAHPRKVLSLIQEELDNLRARYGDPRRTRIAEGETTEVTEEALVPELSAWVLVTERGYVKRMALEVGRRALFGDGRAEDGAREADPVLHALRCNTREDILFFSERGRAYALKAHQLPEAERDSRGLPLSNLIGIEPQEHIVGLVSVDDWDGPLHLVMATRGGRVRRTALAEFRNARAEGTAAFPLDEGDSLVSVQLAKGEEEILLVTESGRALRFPQTEVRPMGRSASGVKGIDLEAGDRAVAMELCRTPDSELLVASAQGRIKRVALAEYPVQRRAGKGVITLARGDRVACARVVQEGDWALCVTASGAVFRRPTSDIPGTGRTARGHPLPLQRGDRVVALVVGPGGTVPGRTPAPSGTAGARTPRKTRPVDETETKDRKQRTLGTSAKGTTATAATPAQVEAVAPARRRSKTKDQADTGARPAQAKVPAGKEGRSVSRERKASKPDTRAKVAKSPRARPASKERPTSRDRRASAQPKPEPTPEASAERKPRRARKGTAEEPSDGA
jgi:DNA gyrase subunit A